MPKRKSNTTNGSSKRARNEEVIVKMEDPDNFVAGSFRFDDEIDSESTSSESSIDSDAINKVVKKFKKKMTGGSSKRYYRLFKRDMELFQKNIDIKLNYIENLLQEVLRNQNKSHLNDQPAHPMKETPIKTVIKPTSKRTTSARSRKTVFSAFNPPEFPMRDADLLEQFNNDVAKDDELRAIVIERLHPHAIFGHTRTHSSRVSYLLNYMFPKSLLCQYTFSGVKKQVEERLAQDHRRAFAEFSGITGIIKAIINHKLIPEEELTNEEIAKAVSNSLKRAWSNRHTKTPVYVGNIPTFRKPQLEVLDPDNDEEC